MASFIVRMDEAFLFGIWRWESINDQSKNVLAETSSGRPSLRCLLHYYTLIYYYRILFFSLAVKNPKALNLFV